MKRKLKYFAIILAIVFGFAGFAGIMAKKNSQSTYAINSTSGNVYGSSASDGLSLNGTDLVVTFTVDSNLQQPNDDLFHHAWYLYLYDASGECPSYDAESHLVTENLTYIRDKEVLDYNGYYSNIGYKSLTGTIQLTIDANCAFYHSYNDFGVYFDDLLKADHDWKVYVGSAYGDHSYINTTFAVDLYVGTIGADGTIVSDTQEEELSITFRPVVVDTRENVTKRVYVNQIPEEVVVKYYVTYNDGVNAFVLVPSYDKNVFTLLDNQNNPRVAVNGIDASAITVTGNVKGENDPEFVKIAFDSSTLYNSAHEYLAESNENVLLLTLTFSVHTAPTEYGHYRGFFGLVLDNAGKTNNTSSVAYQDLSGEELGNQKEVLINLDVDDPNEVAVPENVVDIYKRHDATITTAATSVTYTYRKQAMPVTRVTEYTSNLEYGVEYQYDGNGTPVVTWKDSNNNPLESAPQNAGTYTVTITVPATDTYSAPEPITITVTINPALVTVTINNQSKVYGENAMTFAGNFGVKVPSGYYTVSGTVYGTDNITFNLTSGVVRTSNAGSYPISKTNLSISDGNNGNNYGVDIIDGTYTVTKYTIKVYYGFEQTTFNGGTKTAYSLTGTPNITNNNYEALEEDISELLGTVNVTYSIALPEGVVPANDPEDEEGYYKVTPLYAFVKEGSANNFEVITYQSDYRINQAQVTLKAGNASAEFNGGTKADYAAPTEYYVYAGSTTTPVSEALRTALGNVTLTVNFPETGVVNAGTYTITPSCAYNSNFVVTTSNGTYTINTKDLTDAEKAAIYGAFGIVKVTYDGQGHQMYTFDGSSLPLGLTASDLGTRYSYLAKINDETASDRISVGTYPVTIIFTINDPTINQNRNSTSGTENYQPISLTFVVKEVENEVTKYSSISQKAVTITADNKGHIWGSTPATLTPATAGINGEVAVTFTVQNANEQAVTLSQTTPVGTYTIVPNATNANYAFTFVNGTYTVSKATPVLSIGALPTKYNTHLYLYSPSIQVGNLTLDINGYTHDPEENPYGFNYAIEIYNPNGVKVVNDAWISENYWLDSSDLFENNDGYYTAKLVLTGTDNYNSAEKTAEFRIDRVELAEPTGISYSKGTVTWNEVSTDVDEKGLHAQTGSNSVTVTYEVNGYNCGTTRQYVATAAGSHTLRAYSSNPNYTYSSVNLEEVYSVSYTDGEHTETPTVLTMPATQYLFDGENVGSAPDFTQTVTGYTFDGWYDGQTKYNFSTPVYANKELVAKWNINYFTVTVSIRNENGEVVVTEYEAHYNQELAYIGPSTAPFGEYVMIGNLYPEYYNFTFPTKEDAEADEEYTADDYGKIFGFDTWMIDNTPKTSDELVSTKVTSDINVTIRYKVIGYTKFEVTYKLRIYGNTDYTAYATESVHKFEYTEDVDYETLAEKNWFARDTWYLDEERNIPAPATMPNKDITVYGAYVFDIGTGDVNGDGTVDANDITLYRQWIVGGYEMTIVEAGTEWATAQNYNSNTRYYLAKVADNNNDNSKDIRDVSVTRMAVVGGYTWGIRTGLNVTGQEIRRDGRANSLSSLSESLQAGERVTLIDNITDSNALNLNLDKNIYINLNGKTLTVSQLTLNVNGDRTITIENGTIVTTTGVTLTAPNGSVVLTSVTAYDKDGVIQLQAANHSLHFNGVVNFYQGVNTTVENPTPAVVKVEKGTHIVVEKASNVVVDSLVVTQNYVPVVAEDVAITIDNNSLVYTPVTVVGTVVVDNDVEIDTFEELVAAAAKDGSYILNADIDLTAQVIVTKNVTLDLNGHKLFNSHDLWAGSSWSLVSVQAGKLTINGEGSLLAKANDCYALDLRDGAELVINGGTYVGNIHAVYVHDGALTVNGGHYSVIQKYNATTPDGYVLNCLDANYQNGTATIVVKGGSYEGFNPADCPAESPRGHFVPAEYYVVEAENVYTVLPKAYVTTEAELVAAVESDNYVVLNADIDLTAQVIVTKNVTLELNGHNLYNTHDLWAGSSWSLVSVQAGKLTINGEGSLLAKANDCYALDLRDGAELVINGGNYVGNIHAVYVHDGALTVNGGHFSVIQKYNATTPDGYVLNCLDVNYQNGTATIVVKGGSYEGFNPADCPAESPRGHFVPAEYYVVEEENIYTVLPKTYVSTQEELFAALLENNAYVALSNNVALTEQALIDKNVTLDLNGYTLSYAGTNTVPSGLLAAKRGGTLTINDSNGTGKIAASEKVYAAIALTVYGETANGTNAKVIVNSGTLEGYYYGIVGNGGRHNTEVVVNAGTLYGINGSAIYNPQDGSVTINDGNLKGGETAIEIRAGELVINNGVFESLSNTFSVTGNGSGTTIVGAIISVSQHTTLKNIDVTINGGTFTNGVCALAMFDKVDTTTHNDLMNVTINGGTFNSVKNANSRTVDVQNGNLTINGGDYNSGPDQNDLGNSTILVRDYGYVTINGGTFKAGAKYAGRYWTLNKINSAQNTAQLTVNGGTYYDFDPSNPNTDDSVSYLAEGHTVTSQVVEENTVYTVA